MPNKKSTGGVDNLQKGNNECLYEIISTVSAEYENGNPIKNKNKMIRSRDILFLRIPNS